MIEEADKPDLVVNFCDAEGLASEDLAEVDFALADTYAATACDADDSVMEWIFRLGQQLAVLVIATNWLTGCTTAGFESGGVAACLPVVKYSREFQARAAEELALLPDGSPVAEMIGDYAMMREQVRNCR